MRTRRHVTKEKKNDHCFFLFFSSPLQTDGPNRADMNAASSAFASSASSAKIDMADDRAAKNQVPCADVKPCDDPAFDSAGSDSDVDELRQAVRAYCG